MGVLLACGLVATGAQAQADHLLMSKVVVMARPNPGFGSEYVAITNPTAAAVDLSDYYLTDATFAGAPYWELAQGDGAGGGGTTGDFNARFPAGASLAAGETIVVALEGSAVFQTQFGMLPDFELFEDGASPDDVPDLVEAHPGGIAAGLGNPTGNVAPSTGWLDDDESLILYHWDGATDLVQDVDYLTWGDTGVRMDKSGLTVDGPDVDTTPGTYLADTVVGTQSPMTASDFLEANERLDSNEGTETATGGNGLGGHDETSENLATTWGVTGTMDPPVSGAARFAAPVVTAAAPADAAQYENDDVTIDITLLSPPSNAADEMIVRYRADGGAWNTVGAYPVSGNDWGATIPGQLRDVVVDWWVSVTGEEDGTDTWPSAAPFYYETYTVLPPLDPGDGPAHLLLTEVSITSNDHEFVEIYNPTDEAVDLTDYYLTDACYIGDGANQGYWRLPEGILTQDVLGGGAYDDFHARFPAGTMIGAGEALVISLRGSDLFETAWGVSPDLELNEDGASADAIPELLEVFVGSNAAGPPYDNPPGLSNSAEIVILYYWDGASELVTDVDMFFWGTSTSARVDKTGYTIGSSTYAPDTPLASQDDFTASHEIGGSFQRSDDAETGEPATGGNGPAGHDETGEPLNSTWIAMTGTPGSHGGNFLSISNVVRSPIAPEPEESATITATVSASAAITSVQIHYRTNGGMFMNLMMTDNLDTTYSAVIPGFALDTLVEYYVEVADAEGGTAVYPAGAPSTLTSYTVSVFDPGDYPPHLLLTEVCIQGSNNEFIEIYNPTDEDVNLANYYLTDACYLTGNQGYWRLPEGNPAQDTIGGGAYDDFHARFPADAVIEAGGVLTVAMRGSDAFAEAWGLDPDLELNEDAGSPDDIDEMLEVFTDSNAPGPTYFNPPGLSNSAEIVVLYYWDGVSELVTDIDMFFWGESSSARVDKTGYTIGSSTYAPDLAIGEQDQFTTIHDYGESFQRLDPEEGVEPEAGGNGSLAHNETAENLTGTWQNDVATPGEFSTSPLTISGGDIDVYYPGPGEDITVTVAVTSLVDLTGVELSYRVDDGAWQSVACTDNEDGTWSGVIPGQDLGADVSWYVIATGAGGETAGWPVDAPAEVETYTVDDAPVVGEGLAKLLLTEIDVGGSNEFVEIFNPNAEDVDLSNFYLTDAIFVPGSQYYWQITQGDPDQGTVGGGAYTDFHARFPDGATLGAGEYAVIGLSGSDEFFGEYSLLPTYELFEDETSADNVTDMREIFPGSTGGGATLTNTSETLVLYHWDGISDLVTDIDVFSWGDNADTKFSKTGVSIDGLDDDASPTAYSADVGIDDQKPMMDSHNADYSFQRPLVTSSPDSYSEGDQTAAGSNGVGGSDELSEDWTTTWVVNLEANPASTVTFEGGDTIFLNVPARTFLPMRNERFPINFPAMPGQETLLRIFDLEGRLVRTLFDSRFRSPGPDKIEEWDGRSDTFELVKAGMYIIHLQVTDEQTGERTEKTAPAVVATRLSN